MSGISWLIDVNFVHDTFGERVHLGSLQISAAVQSDEGKYECVAQNSAGVAYSFPANLAVHGTSMSAVDCILWYHIFHFCDSVILLHC